MIRKTYIEMILRQIYGGQPTDDSSITVGLVNTWLNQGIALAAKANYKDNINVDGIGYVNNGFYTTFKGLTVSQDESFKYKLTLPEIPLGLGKNEGISTLRFKDSDGRVSFPCIPLSANQITYYQSMRPIPNKVLYYPEGTFIYALTTLLLDTYTGSVTMVSGGDANNLDSVLNVPSDYLPVITQFIQQQLMLERNQVPDLNNDGIDLK